MSEDTAQEQYRIIIQAPTPEVASDVLHECLNRQSAQGELSYAGVFADGPDEDGYWIGYLNFKGTSSPSPELLQELWTGINGLVSVSS